MPAVMQASLVFASPSFQKKGIFIIKLPALNPIILHAGKFFDFSWALIILVDLSFMINFLHRNHQHLACVNPLRYM